MPNIHQCRKRNIGPINCAFFKDDKCMMFSKDRYNIFPQHNSAGDYVYNNFNPYASFQPGIALIWENLSPHSTGLTFDCNIKRDPDIHPLYHINDIEQFGQTQPEDVNIIFGDYHLSMTSTRYSNTRIMGIQRMETCWGIYGKKNKQGFVIPRCAKNYYGDIHDWIDYTIPTHPIKNKIFVEIASEKQIQDFLYKICSDTKITERVSEAIVYSYRNNIYLNLWDLLSNNGFSMYQISQISKMISMNSKTKLYKNTVNPQKLFYYYSSLDNADFTQRNKIQMKRNIVNYILNDPSLGQSDTILWEIPQYRDWWKYLIVKRAIQEKIVQEKSNKINTQLLTKFKKHSHVVSDPTELDSFIQHVDLKWLKPTVISVSELLKIHPSDQTYIAFKDFALIAKYCNFFEIRALWQIFQKTYQSHKPVVFWNFIESLSTDRDEASNILSNILNEEVSASSSRVFTDRLLESMFDKNEFSIVKPSNDYFIKTASRNRRSNDSSWKFLMNERENMELDERSYEEKEEIAVWDDDDLAGVDGFHIIDPSEEGEEECQE